MHDTLTVAALIGEPSRASMLAALMDGRALTATELAMEAGVSSATASEHLGKLARAQLVIPATQGRHRYFRLAAPQVARMLEAVMVVAAASPSARRSAAARVDPGLRYARTCYDHLAGWLGVALTDSMRARGYIILEDEAGQVTNTGGEFLRDFGIADATAHRTRRLCCRPCLDWTERRVHLAGIVGRALLDRLFERRWIRRIPVGRAVEVTRDGRRGLSRTFGVSVQ